MDRITIEDNEEFLRQVSTEVDFDKDDYKEYIRKLKEYCQNNAVYALAPVQIGIPKRLIYIKNTQQNMDNNVADGYDESIIYINPVVISSKGHTRFLEGCASCMYNNIYLAGVVERPYLLEIEYYDMNGRRQSKLIEGFEATVFSHEYDHLNGVLHMDKSSEIFRMTKDEMRQYRSNHPYEILSKDREFSDDGGKMKRKIPNE